MKRNLLNFTPNLFRTKKSNVPWNNGIYHALYFDSENAKKSFAGKYNCYYLVYYEGFEDSNSAILREKEIKKWRREKKDRLISEFNPDWEFLNIDVI